MGPSEVKCVLDLHALYGVAITYMPIEINQTPTIDITMRPTSWIY